MTMTSKVCANRMESMLLQRLIIRAYCMRPAPIYRRILSRMPAAAAMAIVVVLAGPHRACDPDSDPLSPHPSEPTGIGGGAVRAAHGSRGSRSAPRTAAAAVRGAHPGGQ